MRTRDNALVGSADFLQMLKKAKGRLDQQTVLSVQGHVTVNGEELDIPSICFENITFHDSVNITKFNGPKSSIQLGNTNFARTLCVEQNSGAMISISGCTANLAHFWGCKDIPTVWMDDFKVTSALDLSGLQVLNRLVLKEVEYGDLELIHSSTSDVIQVKLVQTDDIVAATQFKWLGVPVIIPTDSVRKQLEASGYRIKKSA